MERATSALARARKTGMKKGDLRKAIRDVVGNPNAFLDDEIFGGLAAALLEQQAARAQYRPRFEPAPYRQWGDQIEPGAVQQIVNACSLPDAVAGALMPDAHQGYGLPIGGVLGTRNVVIPYAVGMDIACRMKMSVLDLPTSHLATKQGRLTKAIEQETRFGVGATFRGRRQHEVMDEDWSSSKVTAELKDKAWSQLGTSGSGNHFVELGLLTVEQEMLGLPAGCYVALLSHSGSRGSGALIAQHFSKLARQLHPELPRELSQLSWLDLDQAEGQEYWFAMQLMGRYAAANHQLIHRHVTDNLGVEVRLDIENHHNFAWKEVHLGEELVVHRKGATPAGRNAVGIIPGSMASPAFVVRGKGHPESLDSAAHGAGRRMSRKAAKDRYTWGDVKRVLSKRGVTLLSAGLDEVPMAYKDIEQVMEAQSDLVEAVARFDPKLVKMAPAGERPED
jgi:tRNA-splicing ligase RtcB